MAIFDTCKLNASFDEMFDSECNIKEHWVEIASALSKAGIKQLEQKQFEIDWRLEDNGVTYNIYNDPDGINRKWNLDPIPFVLKEEEWEEVSLGLKQRAKLLDLIFKDIYSEQKLLKDGIIPPEIIFSHKGFIPEVVGFANKDYYNLKFYAADISRGPDGKFWLINDRTSAPSGLGYAIENRLTMNSISSELYPNIHTKKLATFVEGFKKMLKNSTKGRQENPLIVLLTPGPHNETYFEHSYLSAFLDLTLVQGEDLLSRDNQIWLKNLSGLKKVDGILRRVDDRYCDPLELKNDSQLGVSGLVNVARNDHISLINPIGIGILENNGLNPFMKNICKYFLNEELLLPQIATWWCGQEGECEYVLEHIKDLIVKKIDRTEKVETYIGNKLTPQEIDKLKEKIKLFPQAYIGQEHINFSTTPSFTGEDIEPRNAIVRAFSYCGENGYEVMNGGLVRVSASKDSLMFSGQKMGYSKDLWILGQDDIKVINPLHHKAYIDSKLENISTKRAENLFWLGRYINRTIITSRMIRFSLKNMINIHKEEELGNTNKISEILNNTITHLTMTYPGFLDLKETTPLGEMISIIKDKTKAGSLTFTLNMLSNSNINVKNLLTIDAWRIFDKMYKNWHSYTMQKNQPIREHINQINNLLIYLMAYKELIDESIFKEQGLILFDIGGKIEVSLLLVSKLRSLLTLRHDMMLQYEVIDSLLNAYESYNSYRAYYQSSLDLGNVLEFLIFNTKYPKSLIYIITELLANLKELPKQKNSDYFSGCEEPIFKIYSKIKLSNPAQLLQIDDEQFLYQELDTFLSQISSLLIQSSDGLQIPIFHTITIRGQIMIYEIYHETSFEYAHFVTFSHNIARLKPKNTKTQELLEYHLEYSPTPYEESEFIDFFENTNRFISFKEPHKKLILKAFSKVRRDENSLNEMIQSYQNSNITYLQAKERFKGLNPLDNCPKLYLFHTDLIPIASKEIVDYATESFWQERPLFESIYEFMGRIFHDFDFESGFSDVTTPIDVIFKEKKGVCQDFAQFAISALRTIGIPTRYVSGYIRTYPAKGEEKLFGTDASHAWFSAYIPDIGWVDFDPTNNKIPNAEYIILGYGRDYHDIAPLKGVVQSSGRSILGVQVDVKIVEE